MVKDVQILVLIALMDVVLMEGQSREGQMERDVLMNVQKLVMAVVQTIRPLLEDLTKKVVPQNARILYMDVAQMELHRLEV